MHMYCLYAAPERNSLSFVMLHAENEREELANVFITVPVPEHVFWTPLWTNPKLWPSS